MAGKRELSLRDLFRFFVRSLGLFIRKHWPSVTTLLIAAVAFIFWWPVTAFLIGWLILLLLSFLVNRIIRSLRVRGGTSGQILKVMKIALSERIAFIEQFLLYLAAVADWEVFKFAAGGWLVFKVVNKYAIWQPAKDEPDHELWAERRRYLHTAAIAHNRFQILP